MPYTLQIRENKLNRFSIHAVDDDGRHAAMVGSPRGYAHEYEAVGVAERFRRGMDDRKVFGDSVEIIGITGKRLA